MPTGTIQLAAYNKEDMYLTHKPNITFFKKKFKRHSMFTCEPKVQYFSTFVNFGATNTCIVAMNGDLLGNMYLCANLPTITSLDINYKTDPRQFVKVRYIDYPGLAMIKSASIEINGKVLTSIDGRYIHAQYEMSNINNNGERRYNRRGLDKMLGNVTELTSFTNGKDSYPLYVPLPFFFTKDSSNYLPLVSLQKSEVRVNIELNDFEKIIEYGPLFKVQIKENGYFVRNIEYRLKNNSNARIKVFGVDTWSNSNYSTLYFNFSSTFTLNVDDVMQDDDGNIITINSEVSGSNINFNYSGYLKNGELLCDYYYLSNRERNLFYTKEHYYMIEEVSMIRKIITANYNSISIGLKNIVTEILVTASPQEWLKFKKYFEYTDENNSLIRHVGFTLNGYDIIKLQNSSITQYLMGLQSHTSQSTMCTTSSVSNCGIHSIPFSLNPDKFSFGGHINMSQFDDIKLLLKMRKDVNSKNPVELNIFARGINFIHIFDGKCEVIFK